MSSNVNGKHLLLSVVADCSGAQPQKADSVDSNWGFEVACKLRMGEICSP